MTHLSRDEFLALAESDRIPDGHHEATCPACREEVLALRAVIEDARSVDLPEPSPLFWDHFSARVRRAIDEDVAGAPIASGAGAEGRWRLLLAGLSTAVLAGLLVVGRVPSTPVSTPAVAVGPIVTSPDVVAAADGDADSGIDFDLVADLAGDLVVGEAADALDVGAPGASDTVLTGLSDEEEQELARLLRAEMKKGRPS